ncbi:hypothetical protein [Wolbachia endosymbiont of Chironomus riparius]|uniref:hypothetical protein n=1 Tax=Wolbachia endosymbiont of Chironomus riparius TaxID=2883238 RepID=UPI00209F8750|nr:hypothetical protein [Wolbachia endosymbiont of Chironomus riparius]
MEVFNDLNRMSSEKYGDLLQRYEKTKDKNDDYCPFVKEFFKEMFQYAGAEVPHDSILEELTTNCNQAGYVGSLVGGTDKPLGKITQNHGFSFDVEKNKTIHINCDNENCVILKVDEHINICDISKPAEVVEGKIAHSLEFKLESQNDKKDVTYKDGKLLLIVPNELKNYTIGEKKLFDVIKEYFEAFCRKLGFNFEIKIEHNFTKPPLTRTNPVEQVEPSNKNQERTTPLG